MTPSARTAWPVSSPSTSRSGCSVSSTAKPSRRNSGFQQSSTSAPAGASSRSRAGQPGGGADGDRRLAGDDRRAGEQRGQVVDDRVERGHVGRELALLLRRADADEVHVAELRGLGVAGGEAQAPGGEVAGQELVEAGLVERARGPRRAPRSWPRRHRRRGPRSRARPCRRRGWPRGSRCQGRSSAKSCRQGYVGQCDALLLRMGPTGCDFSPVRTVPSPSADRPDTLSRGL